MILNTGLRTDIPGFFSEWFYNRIDDGFVYVRNPYAKNQIYSYRLDPELVLKIQSQCLKILKR